MWASHTLHLELVFSQGWGGSEEQVQKFNLVQSVQRHKGLKGQYGVYMEGCGLAIPRFWIQLPPDTLTGE